MADVSGRRVGLVLGTSTGGVGRHVRAEVCAAVARGTAVVVAGPAATEAAFGFTAVGAEFRPVEIRDGAHPVADARAALALRTALRDRDVVHAHGLRAGFLAGRVLPPGVPLVVTWHNALLAGGPLRRLYAVLERATARRADITLCVSADLVERVRGLGGRDVRLAPVGSSPLPRTTATPAEVRRALGVPDGVPLVVAVGRLHVQKGFDLLVTAAGLATTRPEPLVLIAGDGPERAALDQQISATGAPVRLLGWWSDVADLLAAADLVVMSSRWEGSPLAAHETLLAGRPLVAASVGGLPELLGGGAAALVPPEDPRALARAIDELLADPAARAALGAAGSRRGREWPDATTAAERAVEVVAELLGARR